MVEREAGTFFKKLVFFFFVALILLNKSDKEKDAKYMRVGRYSMKKTVRDMTKKGK